MKRIRIGIPRALLYYRYGVLWKKYFESLGCKVIISPETNKEILNLGIDNTNSEFCLSYKIYIGHILYLAKICDYIIVTKVCNYGSNDKVCYMLNGIDNDLILKDKILFYNIEYTKYQYGFLSLIKMGFKINKNPLRIIYSYIYAIKKHKQYNQSKYNENKNKLLVTNKKVLLISNFYNIQDKYISSYIKKYLSNNNITTILSSNLNSKTSTIFSEYHQKPIYLKYTKEMIGALYYYKYQVDAIIFISIHNCHIDNLINKSVIDKNKDIPILNIIVDESTDNHSLETKLESFIDII